MATIAEWVLESGNCKVAGLSINSPSLSTEIELSAIQGKCKKTMKTKAYSIKVEQLPGIGLGGREVWMHECTSAG